MIAANKKRYVVKPVEYEKQTSGGIYVSGTDETQLGEIISVGTGLDTPLELGTKVIVNWQTAFPVKYAGYRVFIIEEDAVLGVVNG